jgi:hypothetical protein
VITVHEDNLDEAMNNLTDAVVEKLAGDGIFLGKIVEMLDKDKVFMQGVAGQLAILADNCNESDLAYYVAEDLVKTDTFECYFKDVIRSEIDYEWLAVEVVNRMRKLFGNLAKVEGRGEDG